MISENLLERGLGALGDDYDVPPQAAGDILTQLRPAETYAADGDGDVATATHRRWPPTRRTWLLSSAAALVVLIVVAFAVGGGGNSLGGKSTRGNAESAGPAPIGAPQQSATGGNDTGSYASGSGGAGVADAPAAVPAVPANGQVKTMSQVPGNMPAQTSHQSQVAPDSLTKIVQTGELDLQVDKIKVAQAVEQLTSYATAVDGIVANSQTIEGDGAPSASVTLRIPNRSFGAVLGQARGLGTVLSEQTKTADVTAQYVDLQARIHALGLTKQTYLGILSKATTIGQILSVQQQVNDIQTQIEQLQGQFKVLTDQTTYATLTVSIDQKSHVKPAVVHHESGMSKAVHRSVSRFVHGIEAIVGVIGPIVLVLLLAGLGWLGAKVGYRIVRRQMV